MKIDLGKNMIIEVVEEYFSSIMGYFVFSHFVTTHLDFINLFMNDWGLICWESL